MIKLNKNSIFTSTLIEDHKKNVYDFLEKKKIKFNFFDHKISYKDNNFNELVNYISFDPFPQNDFAINNDFLNNYYEISEFLLYGRCYFEITNKKIDKNKNKKLKEKRESMLNTFKKNEIISRFIKNEQDIIKNQSNYLNFHDKIKNEFIANNIKIKEFFNYNEFLNEFRNIRNDILKNMNVFICPYCNRQYIDTYSYEGKIRSIAQIDHFLPKSIFPLYSLTLLNFVPSCSYCNCVIKQSKIFPWSPIYVDNPPDEKYFHVKYKTASGIFGDEDGLDISILPKNKNDIDNSYFFRHHEIYENHKRDASEIIKKSLLYTASYKRIIENTVRKKLTNDEFKLMIFGVSGHSSDYLKIPLSKMKNDILSRIITPLD